MINGSGGLLRGPYQSGSTTSALRRYPSCVRYWMVRTRTWTGSQPSARAAPAAAPRHATASTTASHPEPPRIASMMPETRKSGQRSLAYPGSQGRTAIQISGREDSVKKLVLVVIAVALVVAGGASARSQATKVEV